MSLDFYINILFAKDRSKRFSKPAPCLFTTFINGCRQWPFHTTSQAYQATCMLFEILSGSSTFCLGNFAHLITC